MSYGAFSSAECLRRFGFVDPVCLEDDEADGGSGGGGTPRKLQRVSAVRLPLAEVASVPMDVVIAACCLSEGGGPALRLDSLAEDRLARSAVAEDRRRSTGGSAGSPEEQQQPQEEEGPAVDGSGASVNVVSVGHPDDPNGLDALLAAIRVHSGASLELSIADRCYNSSAIRAVAKDVIGWTIAQHWPRTLEDELSWLRHAECDLSLNESLSMAGASDGLLPLRLRSGGDAAPDQPSPLQVREVDVECVDWWLVQGARLRVRELALLTSWHEALP